MLKRSGNLGTRLLNSYDLLVYCIHVGGKFCQEKLSPISPPALIGKIFTRNIFVLC